MAEQDYSSDPTVLYEEQGEQYSDGSFTSMIKKARARWGLKATDLHRLLGIDEDVFRGKCNGNRPATRDFVIAVCATLRLNSCQTDEALRCHKKMFPGFDESNERDYSITQFLDNNKSKKPSSNTIHELNTALVSGGFHELDIIDHRTGDKSKKKKMGNLSPYIITGSAFQMTSSNGYALYGDQYDSLETEYGIDRAMCLGRLRIENKKTEEILHLRCSSEGNIDLFDSAHTIIPLHFERIQDTGVLAPFFSKLQAATLKYHTKLLNRLDDTRNFGDRVSAYLRDGQVYVFAEEYNYRFPEANEYYVMEYYNGKYSLSVYHRSAFMFLYLGEKVYQETLGRESPQVLLHFDSEGDIDAFNEKEGIPHWQKELLPLRKSAYRRMTGKIDKLRNDLTEKKRYIRNPDIIKDHGEEPGWICWFYHVEEEYECYTRSDDYAGDLLYYGKEESNFSMPDGTIVTVSITDLLRAFEFGFHTIDEICRAKQNTGTIDVRY